MNDKDTHLLEEKYKSLYDKVSKKSKKEKPSVKDEVKKVKEGSEAIPDGPIGSLAQVGVEELGEPEPELRERPVTSHVFDILRQIFRNKELGFEEMVKFHYTADGAVAVMENKDGNQYTFRVSVTGDPRVIERK